MDGTIGVDSEPNRGSRFWFEIPMERALEPEKCLAESSSTASVPRLAARAAEGPLILLVEDNAVNREVAVGMLENLGYRTECAVNGLLALESVAETVYAAVLMDCQMPVMDGLSATREIRRREAKSGGRIPIIALTANAMEGNRERCLDAGMDDFLPKPFSQAQLHEVLRRWAPTVRAPEPGEAPPLPRDAPSAVIDTGVLRDIEALGRPALLGTLIDLYLEHSRPLMQTIESAVRDRKTPGLVQALHTLKSSTANLGGSRLTALLKECESLTQEGKPAAAQLAGLPAAYREFCEALMRRRSAAAA